MNKIPKVIHQIWSGANMPLPESFRILTETWKENHPNHEYIFWDHKRIGEFFCENHPDFNYKELRNIIQYFILKHFGGIYVNIDFESIEPMESLLDNKECCLSYSPEFRSHISDSFVACIPNHPFINYVLDKYITTYRKDLWNLNFGSLTELYYQYNSKNEITLLPPQYIIPCTKKEIENYKSGDISDEDMEDKLSDAVSICYFLLDKDRANTTDILYASTGNSRGGAYRAAYRIHSGLCSIGVQSKMLVLQSGYPKREDILIASHSDKSKVNWVEAESSLMIGYHRVNHNVLFSPSMVGIDFEKYVNLINPKIVQLHFTNAGFITIEGLKNIDVPIVWRLPDCWTFTGGCHYFGDCDRYTHSCGKCPLLSSSDEFDVSYQTWSRKKENWENLDMTIVVPTQWMKEVVQKSSLLRNRPLEIIPNGLDIDLFSPLDKEAARKIFRLPLNENIILFGADRAVRDPRKGFDLLVKALMNIDIDKKKKSCFVIFGAELSEIPHIAGLSQSIGIPIITLGVIKEHLILQMAYSAADVMIVPSLEEAFGQTVIEAMACATPVIAFEETGPASIIDHKQNGYLAKYKDSQDLSNGIEWILSDAERRELLSKNARNKVENVYDIRLIAEQYKVLYEKILYRKRLPYATT